jgi:hypothetical protein
MSLTKLSLGPEIILLFSARESLVSDFPAGDGKVAILFYSVAPGHCVRLRDIKEKAAFSRLLFTFCLSSPTFSFLKNANKWVLYVIAIEGKNMQRV